MAAVACLRAAYEEIARGNVDYGTQTFLRLPLYLQAAGRNDEAWREFNNLLTMGYPNQPSRHIFWETHLALVYDKMRLFLQRENRLRLAVVYGVLSYISDLRGRLLAGTTMPVQLQYFEQFATEEATAGVLEPLLRKARLLQLTPEVFALVREWIAALPASANGEFESRLNTLLA